MKKFHALIPLAALFLITGCATNPVTGKKELRFVSEAQEIQMGNQNYARSQQSQGGQYVTDPGVVNYVRKVGNKLAAVSDRQLPYEFVVLNNSVPNAWAMPGGKIAINRGLLVELSSEAELAAVMGHEIVHAAARHGAKSVERGTLLQTGLMLGGIALQDHDYRDIIVGAGGVSAQLLNMKYGRGAELESDEYGIKYMAAAGYDPQEAVTLQETFVRLSGGKKSGFFDGLFASHPPSQARVLANREHAKKYPDATFVGRDEYRRAMAPILGHAAAYQALDQGMQALAKNDPDQALALARKAQRQIPREAHFNGLAAKALIMKKDYRGALSELDQAIRKNNGFYEYHLHKGHLLNQLGNQRAAQQSLATSVKLLPTASAHNALGKMALASGQQKTAFQHFSVAAGADNAAGQESRLYTARLELPSKPSKYIQAGATVDSRGYLGVKVQNHAPIPVANVLVRITVFNEQGKRVGKEDVVLRQAIQPGQTASVPTGIGPFQSRDQIRGRVRSQVMRAAVAE